MLFSIITIIIIMIIIIIIKQRSLVITLLDLRNAFGEVHHELIKSVLRFITFHPISKN